ncbi:MAG: GNAT family N-acetyltransferase [Clostridia bacterium]|nr:GNAT family N-acetyltransferase [Clostridia bacterium]
MKVEYKTIPCTEDDEELIDGKLTEINHAVVPPREGTEEEELVFKIENGEGTVIAGCNVGIDNWQFAILDILWVDEKYRGQGLGSALIREAEKAARERNCYAMLLGTYDFQALPLYKKHGYMLCATIKDWPKGHENYTLMKRLDQPLPAYIPTRDLSAQFEIRPGSEKDCEAIGRALGEYNSAQAHREHRYIPLNKKLLDADGNLIAAIFSGVGSWNNLEIDMLWVDEDFRDQGIGSALLAEIEREAQEQGAYFSLAEGLFDWQDGFFRKNGYKTVGTLEDCPRGHRIYVMEKRF